MIITSIDNKNNLFAVENILPQQLLDEIKNIDLNSLEWTKEEWQSEYNRKRLKPCNTLQQAANIINSKFDIINSITKMNAVSCTTGFWLDGPGFTMTSHVDNSNVFAGMQLFLLDNESCPGTKFTSDGLTRAIFKYRKNSGYIAINGIDQYHEVAGTVPETAVRLCSYTWFLPKL